MTAPTTYAELLTTVENYTHRGNITADVPMLVQMGEAWLNTELKARDMITTADITTSTTDNFVALPTGFREMISFTDDYGDPLNQATYEQIERLRYGRTSQRPDHYAIGSRIDFESADSVARTFKLTYYQSLDIVNSNAPALAVLGKYPNLYVYASMLNFEPFIKNDQRAAMWAEFVNKTIDSINTKDSNDMRLLDSDFDTTSPGNILRGWE